MILDPNVLRVQARSDFNKAKSRANLSGIFASFFPERQQLLSLDDVKEIVKPRGEAYKGLKSVPISLVVGSEGRYRDFNHAFLPKRESLRYRWESVDRAALSYVNLPPVKLYEIGGVYFVRDGNHRVSVARMQGIEIVDAEVISLDSEIDIKPGMTKEDLKREVIRLEKEQVFSKTALGSVVPKHEIDFTATGRFFELLKHIEVHKYYINQDKDKEIPFKEAARSWYRKLYKPITNLISEKKLNRRFPGRTKGDLYMWMIRHWDELKRRHGDTYPLEKAVMDFSNRYGKSLWERVLSILRGSDRK